MSKSVSEFNIWYGIDENIMLTFTSILIGKYSRAMCTQNIRRSSLIANFKSDVQNSKWPNQYGGKKLILNSLRLSKYASNSLCGCTRGDDVCISMLAIMRL